MKCKGLLRNRNVIFFQVNGIRYRTNEAGEGLFYDEPFWYTKQILGTCQFSLRQKTLSGIRKAINRYFETHELLWW